MVIKMWQCSRASRSLASAQVGSLTALLLSCSSGSLGPATDPNAQKGAEAVADGRGVLQLALGAYHSCALFDSGRVACWGDNRMGQLGNGSDQRSISPVLVAGLDDVVELRANNATTCARKGSGTVLCWGANAHGEAYPVSEPALRSAPTPWGAYDSAGEPPSFTPANVKHTPTEIPQLAGAQSLSLGIRHGCALYSDGHVVCWGDASLASSVQEHRPMRTSSKPSTACPGSWRSPQPGSIPVGAPRREMSGVGEGTTSMRSSVAAIRATLHARSRA
jgi:Regulator of chromosome condensation (RCC1) repeat